MSSNNGQLIIWYSSQMMDLDDHLEGRSHGDINVVNVLMGHLHGYCNSINLH